MLINKASIYGINENCKYNSITKNKRSNLILAVENGLLLDFSKIFPYKKPETFDDNKIINDFKIFNILLQFIKILFEFISKKEMDIFTGSDSEAIIRIVLGVLEYIKCLEKYLEKFKNLVQNYLEILFKLFVFKAEFVKDDKDDTLNIGDHLYEIYQSFKRVKAPEEILTKLILVFGILYSEIIFPKKFIEILEKLGELAEKEDDLSILRSFSKKKENVRLLYSCKKPIEAILKGITSKKKNVANSSITILIQMIRLMGGELDSEDKTIDALGSMNKEQLEDHFIDVVNMLQDLSQHEQIVKFFLEKLFIKVSAFVYNRRDRFKDDNSIKTLNILFDYIEEIYGDGKDQQIINSLLTCNIFLLIRGLCEVEGFDIKRPLRFLRLVLISYYDSISAIQHKRKNKEEEIYERTEDEIDDKDRLEGILSDGLNEILNFLNNKLKENLETTTNIDIVIIMACLSPYYQFKDVKNYDEKFFKIIGETLKTTIFTKHSLTTSIKTSKSPSYDLIRSYNFGNVTFSLGKVPNDIEHILLSLCCACRGKFNGNRSLFLGNEYIREGIIELLKEEKCSSWLYLTRLLLSLVKSKNHFKEFLEKTCYVIFNLITPVSNLEDEILLRGVLVVSEIAKVFQDDQMFMELFLKRVIVVQKNDYLSKPFIAVKVYKIIKVFTDVKDEKRDTSIFLIRNGFINIMVDIIQSLIDDDDVDKTKEAFYYFKDVILFSIDYVKNEIKKKNLDLDSKKEDEEIKKIKEEKDEEIKMRDEEIKRKDDEIKKIKEEKDEEIKTRDEEIKMRDEEIKRKDEEIKKIKEEKEKEIKRKDEEIKKTKEEKDEEIKKKDEEIKMRDEEIKRKDEEIRKIKEKGCCHIQ
jgi:hypothetical protein